MLPFSTNYPYLAWWINNHGYIRLGYDYDGYSNSMLMVIDPGGVCWEDKDSSTIEEAFEKAEEYLRTEEFPERFGKQVIREIEASAKKKSKNDR